jgi:hypothetical protein
MMRALARFIDLAERALGAGIVPERLAATAGFRRLQRMGEDIAEDAPEQFDALEAELERELAGLAAGGEAAHAA